MSGKTVIQILIDQPAPKQVKPEYEQPCLTDKIKRACHAVESDADSQKEWKFLKKAYEKLSRKPKLNKQEQKILEKLEDLMIKYGKHDPAEAVDMDGQYMNRGDKDHA
jgi:hypothetical protein